MASLETKKPQEGILDLDTTLEKVLISKNYADMGPFRLERKDGEKGSLRQTLAGLANYLPKSTKETPTVDEMKTAVSASIEAKWKIPEKATNKGELEKMKQDFLKQIGTMQNQADILEAYTEFSGMVTGQIGAANAAGNKPTEQFQKNQEQQGQEQKKAYDFFLEGQKFRTALEQSRSEEAQKATNTRNTITAKLEQAQMADKRMAPEDLDRDLGNQFP